MPGYSWNFPQTRLIHVDVDHAEIGRNYPPDIGILADARTFLRQLLAELERRAPTARPRLRPGTRHRGLARRMGGLHPPRVSRSTARRSGPSASSPTAGGAAGRRRDLCSTPASTTTGSCSSGKPAGRSRCSTPGAIPAWASAPPRSSAPSSPRPSGLVCRVCGDGGFTMVPHVLCTAVEYDIPVVWVVWNNFAWAAIRDLQYAYFDGREIGTAFYEGANREPYNPDFAAWARLPASMAIRSPARRISPARSSRRWPNSPALIDVHVDADVRPPWTGAWALPPIAAKEPVFGAPLAPDDRAGSRADREGETGMAARLTAEHPQHRRGAVAGVSGSFRRRAVEGAGRARDHGIAADRLPHLDLPADGLRRAA